MRQIMMLSSVLLLSACLHGTHSQDWSAYPLPKTKQAVKPAVIIQCGDPFEPEKGAYTTPEIFETFEHGFNHVQNLHDDNFDGYIPVLCTHVTLDDMAIQIMFNSSNQKELTLDEERNFNLFVGNIFDIMPSGHLDKYIFEDSNQSQKIKFLAAYEKLSIVLRRYLNTDKEEEEEVTLSLPVKIKGVFDLNINESSTLYFNAFRNAAYNLSVLWPDEFPKTFKFTMVLADLTQISIATDDWTQITVSIKHQNAEVKRENFLTILPPTIDDDELTEFKAWLKNIKNLAPAEKENLKLLQDWLKDHESLFED